MTSEDAAALGFVAGHDSPGATSAPKDDIRGGLSLSGCSSVDP